MRVLFVQPAKTSPIDLHGSPLQKIRSNMSVPAATILGALQEQGHEIHFLDITAEAPDQFWWINDRLIAAGLTDEQAMERIAAIAPGVLLITSMFTSEQMVVDSLVRMAKKRFPDMTVILGGIHASIRPEWHFDNAAPDFVVVGEGEETIVELLAELASPDANPRKVPGLVFRGKNGDGFVRTPPRKLLANLARLWALDTILRRPDGAARYADVASRKSPVYGKGMEGHNPLTFVLFGSRGCPFGCGYCASTPRTGSRIRHMGAERQFDQFLECRQRYGIDVITNQADTFGQHPDDVDFLQMVAGYRAENNDYNFVINNPNAFFVRRFFSAGKKPEINIEFIELLRNAGFNVVTLAVETTCQRFNRKVNWSQTTEEHIFDLARAIRGAGLGLDVYMMYGFPEQTENEFSADVHFGRKMATLADSVTWHKLSLLPGTSYYGRYILGAGLEDEYRRFILSGRGSCFFDSDELNLSNVSSQRLKDTVAEFGAGWFEINSRFNVRSTCRTNVSLPAHPII